MHQETKRQRLACGNVQSLSDIISRPRVDWDAVMERLATNPEEA